MMPSGAQKNRSIVLPNKLKYGVPVDRGIALWWEDVVSELAKEVAWENAQHK